MGITDKKLKDKRFEKTEKAIIRVFFESRKILSVRMMIRRARISRSTLYRHHQTIYDIVPDYEKYILDKYNEMLRKLARRDDVAVKTIYYKMLIFIFKNRYIFKLIIERGDVRMIEKMIEKMKLKVITEYKLPKNCEKMMGVYRKEVSGMLERWIKNGFREDEGAVLSDIMYLTRTLRSRLGPLAEQN